MINIPGQIQSDGDGYSLVLKEANAYNDLNNAKNWRASRTINGSPGKNDDVTVVKSSEILPTLFYLSQNYPNPFNPKTTITYILPQTSQVELNIYNILGQKAATLVSEKQPAGSYKIEWDARGFASGLYFYRLETDKGFVQSKKLVLLK